MGGFWKREQEKRGKGKNTYQVAFAAVGQPSPIQMAWSSAGCEGMTTVAGVHFWPKSVDRAVPTTVKSASATPKEAADMATWVMK